MICIYEADCTDFSHNGLAVLQPFTCDVMETLNCEYELQMTHEIDDSGKWHYLQVGRILRAPVPIAMTPRMNQVTRIGNGEPDAGAGFERMTELSESMGDAYDLVIIPTFRDKGDGQAEVRLSYGVLKKVAKGRCSNSASYREHRRLVIKIMKSSVPTCRC